MLGKVTRQNICQGFAPRLIAAAALVLSGCATPLGQAPTSYANPVIDADFPDPAVLKAPDGFYYAYATQTERGGGMINIQVARSRDLVAWDHLGDALPAKPGWASRTQDFWAPHVVRHGRLAAAGLGLVGTDGDVDDQTSDASVG